LLIGWIELKGTRDFVLKYIISRWLIQQKVHIVDGLGQIRRWS
jgi:hypothetical protein